LTSFFFFFFFGFLDASALLLELVLVFFFLDTMIISLSLLESTSSTFFRLGTEMLLLSRFSFEKEEKSISLSSAVGSAFLLLAFLDFLFRFYISFQS
jgi:hypothetical protein